MVAADDVREVALVLPRVYERLVNRRWKLKVGPIVFTAFSRDEKDIGFGFPKVERDALVASDPDTFFLPPPSDLRYQWVCAHLDRLGHEEMREFVTDAWRMCTPKMLHELPELPTPAALAYRLVDQGEWGELRDLLHPHVRFTDGAVRLRGRNNLLQHLRHAPTPRPPDSVDVRDGQLLRWER
jgi:hypothetical protein